VVLCLHSPRHALTISDHTVLVSHSKTQIVLKQNITINLVLRIVIVLEQVEKKLVNFGRTDVVHITQCSHGQRYCLHIRQIICDSITNIGKHEQYLSVCRVPCMSKELKLMVGWQEGLQPADILLQQPAKDFLQTFGIPQVV